MRELLIATLVILALALLFYLQLTHTRKIKRERGALFNQVKHLFTDVRLAQDGINYPTLKGKYLGYPVKLEPIVDTTVFRKLPVLWLFITNYRLLDVATPLDALIRPYGTEFFSPNSGFEHDIVPDEGWPEYVRIASPDPSTAPSISVFKPLMEIIADPTTKEVLITPRGIRLVHQLGEGGQGYYRVTRGVEMEQATLTPQRLQPILDGLHETGATLAEKGKGWI